LKETIILTKENRKLYNLTSTSDNNFSKAEFSPDGSKIIVSDYGNNIQIVDAGTQQVLKNIPGFIFSTNRAQNMLAAINKSSIDFYNNHKCICTEMESYALFHNAKTLGKQAASLLTISDSLVTHEEISAEARQTSFNKMLQIALEACL